jgi:Bacteriophage baseplate protein W
MTTVQSIPTLSADSFPGYSLGSNWRIHFFDADGIPLNMMSFEVIDFGAISYREIFQNVKTILATPLMSAALERTLGVDQRIVDLPINLAHEAIVAIHAALFFWEPRVEVIKIDFKADVVAGHLTCSLQLKIKNVFYGTDTPYAQANIFDTPMKVDQALPPMQEPVLIPGPKGDPGVRGSLWFTGTTTPDLASLPPTVQANDMYLNTSNGDVYQFVAVTDTVGPRRLRAKLQPRTSLVSRLRRR